MWNYCSSNFFFSVTNCYLLFCWIQKTHFIVFSHCSREKKFAHRRSSWRTFCGSVCLNPFYINLLYCFSAERNLISGNAHVLSHSILIQFAAVWMAYSFGTLTQFKIHLQFPTSCEWKKKKKKKCFFFRCQIMDWALVTKSESFQFSLDNDQTKLQFVRKKESKNQKWNKRAELRQLVWHNIRSSWRWRNEKKKRNKNKIQMPPSFQKYTMWMWIQKAYKYTRAELHKEMPFNLF